MNKVLKLSKAQIEVLRLLCTEGIEVVSISTYNLTPVVRRNIKNKTWVREHNTVRISTITVLVTCGLVRRINKKFIFNSTFAYILTDSGKAYCAELGITEPTATKSAEIKHPTAHPTKQLNFRKARAKAESDQLAQQDYVETPTTITTTEERTCTVCFGKGTLDCRICDETGHIENSWGDFQDCEECGGNGYRDCKHCRGTGVLEAVIEKPLPVVPQEPIKNEDSADTFKIGDCFVRFYRRIITGEIYKEVTYVVTNTANAELILESSEGSDHEEIGGMIEYLKLGIYWRKATREESIVCLQDKVARSKRERHELFTLEVKLDFAILNLKTEK